MRINKTIILSALLGSALLSSCDNGFEEMNISPNAPENAPTYTIFPIATKIFVDEMRDGWVSGRMLLPWVQYSAQRNYTEEDKYAYRTTTGDQAWNGTYKSLSNLKKVIDICNDPVLGPQQASYGDVDTQIAVARIMMAYEFLDLTNYFGDVPYWSLSGAKNPDFQALQIDTYAQPKYVKQEEIFKNLLQELKEAEAQIDETEDRVFTSPENKIGDQIYFGDASKWKKFANSLRLRIANQIKDVYPDAKAEITDAIAKGVFTSNDDNALQHYGTSAVEGSPFWYEFFVGNRNDFYVNNQLIRLLKGQSGTYGIDPRLQKFAAPLGTSKANAGAGNYVETDDITKYQGIPYGLPSDRLASNNQVSKISPFSKTIFSADYSEVLMEYSEVEFLLSEANGWNQTNYVNGVIASMQKWGVDQAKIDAYVAKLPAASKEHVITQKYIALYMQPQTAWVEYRRTGYPNGSILLLPGQTGYEIDGTPYVFTPLVAGMTDLPSRIAYPLGEQTLNSANWNAAVSAYGGKDPINGKLWWMTR